MKKLLISIVALLPMLGWAAGGGNLPLDHFDENQKDKASLQRGAQTFMNYCMGCHSSKYSRYKRIADDLGIPVELMEEHMIFSEHKIGDLMTNSMSAEDGKKWFGATPPDLTLVGRVRGGDWLYTYMRGFYKDDSRPYGVNNTVLANAGMPHVLMELQGLCAEPPKVLEEPKFDPLTGKLMSEGGCKQYAETGSMNSEEYDAVVYDLVNFLVYNAEPIKETRMRLGVYVLIFLAIFFIPVYLMNKEYWKNIH